PEVVTRFANAVLLARVPLFLFQAVQAAMLPRLTQLAAVGDSREFRDVLRRLFVLVGGVGVVGVVGAFIAGPFVLEVVYEGGIDRRTITLLAFASAVYMLVDGERPCVDQRTGTQCAEQQPAKVRCEFAPC
ncbi:MAG: hypothetical protein ACKOIZ_09235, partial [Actinomycetota bacterium]